MKNHYDDPYKCPCCGGSNNLPAKGYYAGHLMEANTRCYNCGWVDYWELGHYGANDAESYEVLIERRIMYRLNNGWVL